MQIDRKKIEASLRKKGFVQEGGSHRYFYHEVKGKRTGAYAYTSRGTGHKIYSDNLLNVIKKELRLNSLNEVKRLVGCPMDGEEFNTILKQKGIL